MRLTSRIAFYMTLMAGCLIATTAYQLRLMGRIHAVNRELAASKMDAARISIRLLEGVEGVREFAAKSLFDRDYVEQWATWEQAFSSDLAALAALPLSEAEDAHRIALTRAWSRYQTTFGPVRQRLAESAPAPGQAALPAEAPALLEQLDGSLEPLRDAIETLMVANDAATAQLAAASVATVDRAQRIAWAAGGGSLLLALILSAGLFTYLSGRLRRLNHGTREIARGNFDHRIQLPNRAGRDELTELAADFNRMAQRLGELEEMKRDFISHVSHELKAPLASIHETITILLEEIPGPLTGKQRHLLQLSQDSASRLSRMISNLLEAARLDADTMRYRFERYAVLELTREVVAELDPLARRNLIDVRVSATGPTVFECDPERVRDVVANLVGNAFKFAPPSSRVEVEWHVVPEAPAAAARRWEAPAYASPPHHLLVVSDMGSGIPDSEKESIFEGFSQLRRHTRRNASQGVGLGLAICRKIVEAHDGAIWVEDRPGGGSRFCALFPGGSREAARRGAADAKSGTATAGVREGRLRFAALPFRRWQNERVSAG